MAGPAHAVGAHRMEEWDTVVAADRLAITSTKREISPGLPAGKIRKAEKGPPYRLADQEKVFVQTFGGYAWGLNAAGKMDWKEPLSQLWQGFREEYALVKAADLDPKFVKYLLVTKD